MKHLGKFLLLALASELLVVALAGNQSGSTASCNVSADNRCRPVHGTIHSVFTTQNCTSPAGLCTAGTITGAGPLDAATTFTALDVAQSAGLAAIGPPANLSYSGQLTIVASHGTLVTRDLGVLDAAHLAFTEMERPRPELACSRIPQAASSSYPDPSLTTDKDSRENCRAPFVPTTISSTSKHNNSWPTLSL